MRVPEVAQSRQSVVVMLDDTVVTRGLPGLRSSVREAMSRGSSVLVVDVSGVQRLSSAVVGALLWVQRTCAARQVDLRLRGANRQVRELVARSGQRARQDSMRRVTLR
jgi:anti-anti-sigma regulatory factor